MEKLLPQSPNVNLYLAGSIVLSKAEKLWGGMAKVITIALITKTRIILYFIAHKCKKLFIKLLVKIIFSSN